MSLKASTADTESNLNEASRHEIQATRIDDVRRSRRRRTYLRTTHLCSLWCFIAAGSVNMKRLHQLFGASASELGSWS